MTLTKSTILNHQNRNVGHYQWHNENGNLKYQVHAYGPTGYMAVEYNNRNNLGKQLRMFEYSVDACDYIESLAN